MGTDTFICLQSANETIWGMSRMVFGLLGRREGEQTEEEGNEGQLEHGQEPTSEPRPGIPRTSSVCVRVRVCVRERERERAAL